MRVLVAREDVHELDTEVLERLDWPRCQSSRFQPSLGRQRRAVAPRGASWPLRFASTVALCRSGPGLHLRLVHCGAELCRPRVAPLPVAGAAAPGAPAFAAIRSRALASSVRPRRALRRGLLRRERLAAQGFLPSGVASIGARRFDRFLLLVAGRLVYLVCLGGPEANPAH